MIPQSWIINCLKKYKISDEAINFIEKTMKTCRVELTAGVRSLAEIKIQRSIFQGDALSSLLFIIAIYTFHFYFYIYFYNSSVVKKAVQFVNKEYITNRFLKKKEKKRKKKRLKRSVQHEKNQPELQC